MVTSLEFNNIEGLNYTDIKIGMKALIEELQELKSKNEELEENEIKFQDLVGSLKDELVLYKSKHNIAEDEIVKIREDYAELEMKYSLQKDEIKSIMKDNNQLNRTKTELLDRIESLTKAHMKQEKEWMNKEKNLLTNIKESQSNNRELKRKSLFLDMQLQEAISENSVKDELSNLKDTISKQEKIINSLKYDLEITKDVLISQTEKERVQLEEMERLRSCICELEESNTMLSDENESYQILLKEKTLSGELMDHPFMQTFSDKSSISEVIIENNSEENNITNNDNSNGITIQVKDLTLCDELSDVQNLSVFDKSDPKIVKYENKIKKQNEQIKSLTLYLKNVIQKMMSDPHLEEVEDSSNIKKDQNSNKNNSIKRLSNPQNTNTLKNRISSFFR